MNGPALAKQGIGDCRVDVGEPYSSSGVAAVRPVPAKAALGDRRRREKVQRSARVNGTDPFGDIALELAVQEGGTAAIHRTACSGGGIVAEYAIFKLGRTGDRECGAAPGCPA